LIEINASDKRGIDDIRDITKEMHYSGFGGGYKGILLDEVHMLSKPAFNCLLKPLEESPQHCVWFLCTTEVSKIPKTIQTRCQIYKLNTIRWSDIYKRVTEVSKEQNIQISDSDKWVVARNSDNNLRQALHLLEQYSVIGDITKVLNEDLDLNFLEALKNNDEVTLWKIFSKWDDKFTDIDAFLNTLKYDLSTCLKLKIGLSVGQISPYRKQKYQEIISYLSEEKLIKTFNYIIELQQKISGVWDYNSLFLTTLLRMREIK
jgi:DNA polymerase-3 subunit gamma/tau